MFVCSEWIINFYFFPFIYVWWNKAIKGSRLVLLTGAAKRLKSRATREMLYLYFNTYTTVSKCYAYLFSFLYCIVLTTIVAKHSFYRRDQPHIYYHRFWMLLLNEEHTDRATFSHFLTFLIIPDYTPWLCRQEQLGRSTVKHKGWNAWKMRYCKGQRHVYRIISCWKVMSVSSI